MERMLRTDKQTHKLASVTDDPFRVVRKTDTTDDEQMGEEQERVVGRVVEVPQVLELIWKEALQDKEDGKLLERAEGHATAEVGTTPVNKGSVIDRIIDQSNENGRCKFKVKWNGFACPDDI